MPDVPIDRSGVVTIPDNGPMFDSRVKPSAYTMTETVLPGCVIRGINCPFYGNGGIRAKVDAAIAYLDDHGLQQFTARVAIDRAALIMLREEFQIGDRLKADFEREIVRLQEENDFLRSGQGKPEKPSPDARNTPIYSESWLVRLIDLLPEGSSIDIVDGRLIVTIPR